MNKKGVRILAISMALAAMLSGTLVCVNKAKANNSSSSITVVELNNEVNMEDAQNSCDSHVDGEEMTVEEMKNHLIEHGYSEEDFSLLYVCNQIEDIQKNNLQEQNTEDTNQDSEDVIDDSNNDNTNEGNDEIQEEVDSETLEIIEQIDEEAEAAIEDDNNGTTGSAEQIVLAAYQIWNALNPSEKVLVATHPVKALAVNATSSRATELAIMNFGYNGLGDKSDAFRHGLWNCLMTREIGKKYAEKFATAHEGKKTEEELQVLASDRFPEYMHLEMDMHNNEVGRNTIGEDEDIKSYNDEYLSMRIMEKMTNNKEADELYWLHF